MSLNDRIREARRRKGVTQAELGLAIGVAKTTVSGYEKNREPTAAQLGAIADFLDVDVTFLLQDEIKKRRNTQATPDEMENLVNKYRSLDTFGQETVSAVLACEKRRCDQLKPVECSTTTQTFGSVFNIQNAYSSVIGNGNQTTVNQCPAIQELRLHVETDTSNDKELLMEIVDLLEKIIEGEISFSKGMFSKFSAVMERNPWMASAASETLLAWMTK